MPAEIDRFWSHVDRSGGPDACWPWTAARFTNGYGAFAFSKRRIVRAHRFIFSRLVRPLAGGEIVRHGCDNPLCVNPDHLVPGTHAENMADMVERGRQSRGLAHGSATRRGLAGVRGTRWTSR